MVGYRAECDGAQAKNASFNKRALARNHVPAERREQEQRTEEAEIRGNTPVSRLARFRIYRSDRTLLCSRVGDSFDATFESLFYLALDHFESLQGQLSALGFNVDAWWN